MTNTVDQDAFETDEAFFGPQDPPTVEHYPACTERAVGRAVLAIGPNLDHVDSRPVRDVIAQVVSTADGWRDHCKCAATRLHAVDGELRRLRAAQRATKDHHHPDERRAFATRADRIDALLAERAELRAAAQR